MDVSVLYMFKVHRNKLFYYKYSVHGSVCEVPNPHDHKEMRIEGWRIITGLQLYKNIFFLTLQKNGNPFVY